MQCAIDGQNVQLGQPIVLGTNSFGWTTPPSEAHTMLDRLAERSPVLVDTAEMYKSPTWRGPEDDALRSEVIIGDWMSRRARGDGEVLIASKVGADPAAPGLRPDSIRAAADRSLARLKVDAIDIYYAHRDDPTVPLADAVAAFEELRVAGKIRAVGLSTFSAQRMVEWIETADRLGAQRPVSIMQRYNLLERRNFERDYLPVVERYGLVAFPFFALASGFLTGKYSSREEVEASDRSRLTTTVLSDDAFAFLPFLKDAAAELGVSPGAVATAWVAQQPGVMSPVVGARNDVQLKQTLTELRVRIPDEMLSRLTDATMFFA